MLHLFPDLVHIAASSELFSYSRAISYAVITALISLDRVTLKTKVSPVKQKQDQVEGVAGNAWECFGRFWGSGSKVSDRASCPQLPFIGGLTSPPGATASPYLQPHATEMES